MGSGSFRFFGVIFLLIMLTLLLGAAFLTTINWSEAGIWAPVFAGLLFFVVGLLLLLFWGSSAARLAQACVFDWMRVDSERTENVISDKKRIAGLASPKSAADAQYSYGR
jgi:hypothetical protein